MKNLLCYLGIIILLFLILFPPILRITLPDKEKVNEKPVFESKALSCSNDFFITNTRYENEKVQMIVLKKLKLEMEDGIIQENEMLVAFNELKEKSDVSYSILEDGEAILIDFTVSDHQNLNLSIFTKPIELQKLYYESQDLSCYIR